MARTTKPKKETSETMLLAYLIGEMMLLAAAVVGVLYWLGFIKL
ncbi:MAG TPA: hypothetical protein VNN18_09080 [Candidatus Xenobia bacterium]|nr:hypothetical protein [Candidatus Xenobia bacterium]